MSEARPIPHDSIPFWDSKITLGMIRGGKIRFTQDEYSKQKTLGDWIDNPGEDTLLIAWTGKWSTDLFSVTREDAMLLLGSQVRK